ncbi:GNAT family N-acetyltransferase [Brevundimonas sp. 2R-24]|uniref:GNAT family N-acetyltransferase n=1 Tax=Peiella sedimenti TaxID=3061083 RepID=A0ABT8SQN4_9CAUL|nr:GNAT family N-acetyltransferase [Caulobacteraceae bacterium XZ-24]
MTHPLDRPIWSALNSRQAPLAIRSGGAIRFAPEYTPFGACDDAAPDSFAALKALAAQHGDIIVVEADPLLPPGIDAFAYPALVQMIWAGGPPPPAPEFAFSELDDADADEMRELALLTRPGPYSTRTHRLGGFIGVRREGRLIAMSGERMKPDGFTEVSGVCTHPDHRGQGLAAGLMGEVIRRILARGETPFLHAYAENTGAIALYESLGLAIRRPMVMLGITG